MNTSIAKIEHISARIITENLPDDINFIESLAEKITSGLNLKVVKRLKHKFSPRGATLVYILSQSHLTIHAWPESGTLHIDLVSCGGPKIADFDRVLKNALGPINIRNYDSELHPF